MGASESTARTNGTKEEEEEERQRASGGSSTAAGAAMSVAAVGVAAWGISKMLSNNTEDQENARCHEEEEKRRRASGGSSTAAIAAVGVAAWGISRMLSNNTEDQENEGAMKMQGNILQHQPYLPNSSINNNHGSGYEGVGGSNPTRNTWSPPPLDRFKMNTDGSCRPNEGQGQGPSGYAGVLRNHCGKWVRGFYGFMGVSDCLSAEFYGIYYGLRLLDDLGLKEATLESDCEAAVNWIMKEVKSNGSLPPIIKDCWKMITDCKDLIRKNKIILKHCSRDSNKLADKLVNMAIQEQDVYTEITSIPDGEIKRIAEQESSFAN